MKNPEKPMVAIVGVFSPKSVDRPQLSAGQVGFVIAGVRYEVASRSVQIDWG